MKFHWFGTIPQWLSSFALGWIVYLQHVPNKIELPQSSVTDAAPRGVKVVNFPHSLTLPLIPVEVTGVPVVQALVQTERAKPLYITMDPQESLSVNLTSIASKDISIGPNGNLRAPKSSIFETLTTAESFQDVGLSVDVKSISR